MQMNTAHDTAISSKLSAGLPVQTSMLSGRVIVWFSCGAASACSLKFASLKYPDVHAVYCDTSKDEHSDNMRFMRDVERWAGLKVEVIRSKVYGCLDDVWSDRKFMSGVSGAPCTEELKRKPRIAYQYAEDVHIFGMTVDEQERITNFEDNNREMFLEWILRDKGMRKQDCLQMISDAGIDIPAMYKLGFKNNNCIGCVKAQSPKYWNMVRRHFPAVFEKRATQSRRLGARLVRVKGMRIFLDELAPNCAETISEDLSCGPQCVAPKLEE